MSNKTPYYQITLLKRVKTLKFSVIIFEKLEYFYN